jgi:hypothetical protein
MLSPRLQHDAGDHSGPEAIAPGRFAFQGCTNPRTTPMKPTTLTLRSRKPRNPLVAPALFRQAGAHGQRSRAARQQAERALRHELDRLHRPSP